jgi:hypothetical protein
MQHTKLYLSLSFPPLLNLGGFIHDGKDVVYVYKGVAPLAMPRRWRTVVKNQQAEKIP